MRRVIGLIACIALMGVVTGPGLVAQTPMKICALKISGMTCSGCEAAVRLAAKSVAGVKDVKVSYETGRADVTYDSGKTTPAVIAKAVADKTGYKAEVQDPKTKR